MKLADYLKKLSYSELSNLRAGNDGTGSIKQDKIPYVVDLINEALLRLYSRFVLKTNTVLIECNEVRTRYHLSSKHSWLCATEEDKKNPTFSDKFIRDDPEHPFKNDIIKILSVTTSGGVRLPLNNHTNPLSVYTPVYDVLEVPVTLADMALTIVYQAKHETLDWFKDPNQEINIPESLTGALSAYVAFQFYSNMNTQEAVVNAQKFLQTYTNIVQETTDMDLNQNSYNQDNIKFRARGFI